MTVAYPYTDPWTVASASVLALSMIYVLGVRVFSSRCM